ncbi:uncharacterized protein LOC124672936 [Lolium rigidum]|uniref:uncharacterized protein LOC124672936 n=1 Tax=Lolium rigidum TaxID=89674 RepID=UPI001F5C8890|nr:uncharacterized protein LOC124672936 [Lolium rigidum]
MSLAHLAWGDASAPFVFLVALTVAALKVSICIAFLFLVPAVLLCGIGLAYVIAVESRSGSQPRKRAFGPITRESIREFIKFVFPHAVVLGLVADLAFTLLSVAGALVMCMSPSVEGSTSQGEMIGSVIMDVGMLGFHAISCFVIIPAFALHILRKDQADRKAGLSVAVC